MKIDFCPLCGQSQDLPFDQRSFGSIPVSNRLCAHCGLVYQSPRMSDAELDAFYQQEYRQLYQGSPGPSPKDLAVQVDRAGVLVSFAQGLIPRIESHLDIGCSAGLLLQGFQHAYGCRSVGVEPGTAYREYVQAQGLTVFASLDDLPPTRFDLVSLAHVLEHIPEPRAYLARLRQDWLAQTGWLLVEVPNLYGHDCFEPAHLVSYSPHTLEQMLKQAGFQVRACDIHGRPRSAILPLYITVLAQPLDSGLSPDVGQAVSLNQASLNQASLTPSGVVAEHSVRRKRRLAMLRRRLLNRLYPRKAWLPIRLPPDPSNSPTS